MHVTAAPGRRLVWMFASGATLIVAIWSVLMRSRLATVHPDVAIYGSAFDLLITIPLLYWFFVVRRRIAEAWTTVPLVVGCAMAAHLILPRSAVGMRTALELLVAPAELILLAWFIRRVRRALKNVDGIGADPIERLRAGARAAFGDTLVTDIVLSEFGIFYYALFSWPRKLKPRESDFTSYRRSEWESILAGLILAIVCESGAMHLWLQTRSPVAAWALTLLDLYGILWLLGDYRAMCLLPTRFRTDGITLRLGSRWAADVRIEQISSIRRFSSEDLEGGKTLKLAVVEAPQFTIELRELVTFRGFYGLSRRAMRVALLVDDADRFESAARATGLWSEPEPAHPAPSSPRPIQAPKTMSYERWMATRPSYISLEDWTRNIPPHVRRDD